MTSSLSPVVFEMSSDRSGSEGEKFQQFQVRWGEISMRIIHAAMILSVMTGGACAGDVSVINDKAAFPEGPAFIDGKLHYVEYGGNTIDVWDGKTNTVLWKSDGCGPSAVLPLGTGDLVVTCYDAGTDRPRLT